jgi:hypothetical protein
MKSFVRLIIFFSVSLLSFAEVSAEEVAQYPTVTVTGSSEANGLSSPLYLQRTEREVRPQRLRVVPKFSIIDAFPGLRTVPKKPAFDAVLQKQAVLQQPAALNAILQGIDFEGTDNIDGALPPDPNLAVGPNHIVQIVNMHFEIWDKAGNRLFGPKQTTALWSAVGGPCADENDGDGIALYDQLANRWLMTQFSLNTDPLTGDPRGPFYECISVSQTPDPTGAWFEYAFNLSKTNNVMNDYPKLAVWPDAYYMSDIQFSGSQFTDFAGVGAYAFDRSSMLQGKPATYVYFNLNNIDPALFSMLPSNLDGATPPSVGTPNYFAQFDDSAWGYPQDQLEIWKFHVDWNTPSNSTFTDPAYLATAPFDSNLCNFDLCVTQPGTSQRLDALSDRLMFRLQYRNFASYKTMVVNHTVDANGANLAGIRWYELRNSGSGWQINQQGTYSPDANNRWMGSIAMDGAGNIALGYSVSSSTVYPSIRYTGRLAGDPPGTMSQGEKTLIAGGGAQLDSSGRWGDYSSMVVDPSDDRTFWYTQEYYSASSEGNWQTRIGSFRLQAITPPTLVSLTPSEVSSVAGAAQTFTAVYGDPAGYTSLKAVDIAASSTGSGANAIWARYDRGANTLHLFNNAGTAFISASCAPGSPVILQNARGILNCQQTSVTGSGNNLTVNWSITPKISAFPSTTAVQVLMFASDAAGLAAGPTTMGSWTILTSKPEVVSFTPPPSLPWPASVPQTVTAVYGDNAGFADIKNVDIRMSPAGDGVNSIWARYNRNKNLLFIYNSSGTTLKSGSCTPGSSGTLKNSNGGLNCLQTTVTGSGNNLTVRWNITPKPAFASSVPKIVKTIARDNSGLTSGWITEGSWTISP